MKVLYSKAHENMTKRCRKVWYHDHVRPFVPHWICRCISRDRYTEQTAVLLKCTQHKVLPPKHSAYRHKGKWLSWFCIAHWRNKNIPISYPVCMITCLSLNFSYNISFLSLCCLICDPFHCHLPVCYCPDASTFISSCICHPSHSLLFIFSLLLFLCLSPIFCVFHSFILLFL